MLVSRFGGSTRGLALSLAVGEALLAPGMPSTTARAAGAGLTQAGRAGNTTGGPAGCRRRGAALRC
jgi:di/tricarboxylate transporter